MFGVWCDENFYGDKSNQSLSIKLTPFLPHFTKFKAKTVEIFLSRISSLKNFRDLGFAKKKGGQRVNVRRKVFAVMPSDAVINISMGLVRWKKFVLNGIR